MTAVLSRSPRSASTVDRDAAAAGRRAEGGAGRPGVLPVRQPQARAAARGPGLPRRADPQRGHGHQRRRSPPPGSPCSRWSPPSWSMGVAVAACLVLGLRLRRRRRAAGPAARRRLAGGGVARPHGRRRQDRLACIWRVLIGWYRFETSSAVRCCCCRSGSPPSPSCSSSRPCSTRRCAPSTAPPRAPQPTGERPSVLRSLLVAPTDYGVLCLVFLLLGAPAVFVAGYGVLFLAARRRYLALALGQVVQRDGQVVTMSTSQASRRRTGCAMTPSVGGRPAGVGR